MRTSTTHPLHIAILAVPDRQGRIGITFCPGKVDPLSPGGGWNRDLDVDLDAIRDWGTTTVVTLIEAFEFDLLQVPGLGSGVRARGMDWQHLPIIDLSVPDTAFERQWVEVGPALQARLVAGERLVIHCRGGIGRAGTIAARLLVEAGVEPETAIRMVRAVRPGAIETRAQEAYVRRQAAHA